MDDGLERDAAAATAWLKSHQVRVSFESVALAFLIGIVVVACLIGFWSDAMAARVHQLAGDIKGFLGLLGLVVGGSWTRGAIDNGVEKFGGPK